MSEEAQLILKDHTSEVYSASFSPDGNYVLTASGDGTARIWDVENGKNIFALGHKLPVQDASFSSDGKYIATTGTEGIVRIWEFETQKIVEEFLSTNFSNSIIDMQVKTAFSPDGQFIFAAGSEDRTIHIWDIITKREIMSLIHPHRFYDASYSPDGSKIITASRYSPAHIWDVSIERMGTEIAPIFARGAKGGEIILSLAENDLNFYFFSARYSPDGRVIVTSEAKQAIVIWDAASGDYITSFPAHEESITMSKYSPDGKYIVSSSYDKTARVWDAITGQELHVLTGHEYYLYDASFDHQGKRIVTASADTTARIWRL